MKYSPLPPPIDIKNVMVGYTYRELKNISVHLLQPLFLDKTFEAPNKPIEGEVRYADGTVWNPGGGEGIYAFYNSTWNKLG